MNYTLALNAVLGTIFVVFWLCAFFILYHLTRFGAGIFPKRLALLFLIGAVLLSSSAVIFYLSLDINSLLS